MNHKVLGTPRGRAWAAALLWIALIYVSLPLVLNIYLFFFERGLILPVFSALTLAACLWAFRKFSRLPAGYRRTRLQVGLVLGAVCYPFLYVVETPGEWVHLPEYLVAGILFHGALRHDLRGGRLLAAGVAIIAIAGLGDELIQSTLPKRFFAWRDVFLNIGAGAPPLAVLTRLDRKPPIASGAPPASS